MSKDKIHGNSKKSSKKQHIYLIIDKFLNEIFKFGISGLKLNKNRHLS